MLEQYAQVMGLRNEMQMQPLRQQMAQAQIAGQQLSNQQTGLNLQDEKAASAAMREYYGRGGEAGHPPRAHPGGTGGSPSAPTPGPQATAPTAPGAGMAQSASARLGGASGSPAALAPPAASEVQQTRPFFDPTALGQLILKNGGSAKAVIGMQQLGLAMENTRAQVFKNLQQGNEAQVASTEKRVTAVADALSALRNVPDSQLAGAFQDKVDELNQEGLLDPAHLQFAQQIASIKDPAQQRAQIYRMDTAMMGSAQAIDLAKKQFDEMSAETTAGMGQLKYNFALQHPELAPGAAMTDSDKFVNNWLKKNNLPPTPGNLLKGQQEFIKETKIAPAQVRVEGYAQSREMPVIDTLNGNRLVYANAADINQANATTPGRFAPAAQGTQALGKTGLIEDIRGTLQSVRDDLKNPNMPEFTADQRAQIAIALNKPQAQDAISAALRGGVLGSLSPDQQDYLIHLAQLKENAMAMRSVLGAGQGSDDLRAAITATIPGPRTPSKEYAAKQLDAFENVLNRVEKGIPGIPLAPNLNQPKYPLGAQPAGSGGGATASGSMTITLPSGKKITIE